ncbi:MAG: PQQ-binding-like beta-propeller repeat protein [Thermoguttaceae bacterium]|jgi:outer membrane protein assembly factor BamB
MIFYRFLASRLLAGILALELAGSAGRPAGGQEWTRFRGPNGSGECETAGIPATWTNQDYKWRVKLPGSGHSSPVVWGDRVYVTAARAADATRIVCCLDASDGTTVWQRTFPSKPHPMNDMNSFASSTPVVDRERIYLACTTPEEYTLVALDRIDGQPVWRRELAGFVAQHGFGASPILLDDLLIVPNDQDGPSSVVAVECATGKTRWTAPRESKIAAYSTPIVYRPDHGRPQLILTSTAHGFSSLDPLSGAVNWELKVLKHRTVGSPMLASGLIVAAAGEGGGGRQLLAVRPGDPLRNVPPAVAYEVEGKLPYVVTPVARGNLLFLWSDQGVVTCLEATSGKRLWSQRVGGRFFGSPIRVRDRLYAISREGEVVVLAAADRYQLLGRMSLGEPSQSTPAVAGGVLYLRTLSQVMAVGGRGI